MSQSDASSYRVPMPPAAATLTEGLAMAFRHYAQGKIGWMLLIGSVPPVPVGAEAPDEHTPRGRNEP